MTPSFDSIAAFPLARWQALSAAGPVSPSAAGHLQRGSALHAAGLPEFALREFELALTLAPHDANLAHACAAVLIEVGRPAAALEHLLAHAGTLSRTAEGACNLAFACALNGDTDRAREFYEAARVLDPRHVRALDGLSRLAALRGEWGEALGAAQTCAQLEPRRESAWLHWIDLSLHARHPVPAQRILDEARKVLGTRLALDARQALLLAIHGDWNAAVQLRDTLLPDPGRALQTMATELFTRIGMAGPGDPMDVGLWCVRYHAAAIAEGDWACRQALFSLMQHALADATTPLSPRAWVAVRPVADALALSDAQRAALHARADLADTATPAPADPVWLALQRHKPRLRIGWLVPRLDRDGHAWLAGQLAQHNGDRFDIRVYSQTPFPLVRQAEPLPQVTHTQEVSHFTDAEMVARLRLDQLDLLIDFSFATPDARTAAVAQRVAQVQARAYVTTPSLSGAATDYLLSDRFTHRDPVPQIGNAALLRLPVSPWLSPADLSTGAGEAQGGEIRLCVTAAIDHLEPESFDAWLEILRGAADTRLELPACGPALRYRLRTRAQQAGLDPQRLLFPGDTGFGDAALRLHLDPLHRSAPQCVARALAAGQPVVTCPGSRVASRTAAAVVQAAGHAEGVAESRDDYVVRATLLAGNRDRLLQAGQRLRQARIGMPADAPWWNGPARAREMEHAWVHMVETARAHRPPQALDIPPGAQPG